MSSELSRPSKALTTGLAARSRTYRRGLAAEAAVADQAGRGLRNNINPPMTLEKRALAELQVPARNVRKRDQKHVADIMKSIRGLGMVSPIIITAEGEIMDGVTTYLAAEKLGMTDVPCVVLHELGAERVRLVRIALNRLQEKGSWDLAELKLEFEALAVDHAPLEITGFSLPEIDQIMLDAKPALDAKANRCPAPEDGPAVSRAGDLWLLGKHRVLCGDATAPESYKILLGDDLARMVFADPPYNVKIDGFVGGTGSIKHREFIAASGEMSDEEFIKFLARFLKTSSAALVDGGIVFVCMDWRHASHVHRAAETAELSMINLICWTKGNAGLGGLYRSAHELIFVMKKGGAPHINNVQLGKHGRDRTNVWVYPGANIPGSSANKELVNHPTPKPAELVADAVLDVSNKGDLVLDPFLGSGTTIIAAEKTGRAAYGLELDPKYVDRIVRRYEEFTGKRAVLAETGQSFAEATAQRATKLSECNQATHDPLERHDVIAGNELVKEGAANFDVVVTQ